MNFKTLKVWEELTRLDPTDVTKRSLATYNSKEESYIIQVIDQEFIIRLKNRVVEKKKDSGSEKAPWQFQIFIPIYMVNAKDVELEGGLISPNDLIGGDLFFAASAHHLNFDDLVKKYSSASDFLKAGCILGGKRIPYGEASFKLNVLPRLPIYYVYRLGGEEFPSSINVFFDATAKSHLPTDSLWLIIEVSKKRLLEADI